MHRSEQKLLLFSSEYLIFQLYVIWFKRRLYLEFRIEYVSQCFCLCIGMDSPLFVKNPQIVYFHKLKGISIVMSRHWHVRAGALYCLEYVVWHMYCTRSNLLCDIELILGLVYWLHLANLSKTLHLPRPAYLLLLFEDRDMSPSMNSSIMSFKHYLKQFLYASAYLSIDSRGIFWAIGIFHYVYDGRPLWSSSWLQGITAIWPLSRYTAWSWRHVCVWTTCPESLYYVKWWKVELTTSWSHVKRSGYHTTRPHS